MAARYLAGAAYVQVLPSLRGFQKQIGRDLKAVDVRATARIVPELDKQAASKAEDDVQALTDKLSKARAKEADAIGKVRVAEEKLSALRNSGKATAAQMAAAEERLASATRASEQAQTAATKSAKALEAAQRRHKAAVDDLEKSANRGSAALARLWQQGEGVDRMSKSMRTARRDALALSVSAFQVASNVGAIGSAVPTVTALGGALGTAAGAGLLVPGALVAGGLAVAALKLGVSGLGDAFKAVGTGDAKKLTEALAKLSPEARAVVLEYQRLKPALDGVKSSVQDRFLQNLSDDMRVLGRDALPLVKTGLTDMAGALNNGARQASAFAVQKQTLADLPVIFDNSQAAVFDLTGATQPLLSVLRDIVFVGSQILPTLTAGAAGGATTLAEFVAQARATGQLEQWIRNGLAALDQFAGVLGNVGSIIGSIFGASAQATGGGLLTTVYQVTGAVAAMLASAEGQNALITLFTTLQQVTQNLLPGVQTVLGVILAGVVEIGPQLPALASGFSAAAIALSPLIADAARLAADILPSLAALIQWLAPALPVLAVGFAAGAAALKAYAIVSTVVRWVQAWAAAQWSLNAAMSANPIGIIIVAIAALVAGFIYLWNHSEAFRNFWIGLWEHIKTAALWVWENVLKPTWDAIVAALKWVGEAAVSLWTGYIQPAFEGIAAVASAVWSVLSAVFDGIWTALKFVGAIIFTVFVAPYVIAFNIISALAKWLWETVLRPVLTAIGEFFGWLWDTWILPVVTWIGQKLQLLGLAFSLLWTAYVQPALAAIGDFFSWLWDTVISVVVDLIVGYIQMWASIITWLWTSVVQPVFGLIGTAISAVGDAFSWAYNNVIKPVWDALGAAISWVWDNVLRPVFDAIKSAVGTVGEAFDKAVSFIGEVWNKLKSVVAGPVNFVIDVVYNNGIRGVWNKVADFVGLDQLGALPLLQFAGGGVLSGYAPGRDTELALLSRGEAVLVPELVREIGPQNILAANAAASGRPAGGDAGFAGGGVVRRYAGGGIVDTLLSFIPGIGDDLAALWKDPVGYVKARIGGASGWIDMLAAVPETLISKAVDWLGEKVDSFFSFSGGGTEVSGQLADWIRSAMAITGVGADWFGPLTTLIMRESGGNPAAINLWDINAQNGVPSQGLMQTIPPTFAAYRDPRLPNDILNPIANIVAGINYIKARYGSIFTVQQANASAPPMGYDSGGFLPPGYSTVYNGTGRPEPVLTDEQWAALTGGNGPMKISGELTVNGLDAHIDGRIEAADESTGTAVLTRRRL